MVDALRVLQRVSQAQDGGWFPVWLSTHPDPGDRYQRLLAAVQQQGLKGGNVRREAYLDRLDGMTFGENPREGFFREGAFYHPDLRFRFVMPRGFKGQNTKQAVWAVSPNGDAVFQLTLAEGDSPDRAARARRARAGDPSPARSRGAPPGRPWAAARDRPRPPS